MRHFGNIISAADQEEWVTLASQFIGNKIRESLSRKERCHLAISGGNTPGVVFEALIHAALIDDETWKRVDFYWVDERLVSLDDPQSNAGNALKILGKLPSRFFPMYKADSGSEMSLKAYREQLKALPQQNQMPVFDLVLLGMGDDGHTASLFPESPGLQVINEAVILNDVTQLKTRRMTLTYPVLHEADAILILFNGKQKTELLQEMILKGTNYPIAGLLRSQVNKTWMYYV